MPIVLKEEVGQQVSAGTHIAVCYRIAMIGTQPDSGYGEKRKLVISWEIPGETIEIDGKQKPMTSSKFYSLGSSGGMNKKSALRQDLAAWRGRDFNAEELKHFELKAILGKPCQIVIEHSEEGRAKVDRVAGLAKGMPTPGVTNQLVEYHVEQGRDATYKMLPEWLRKMCDQCIEWNPDTAQSKPTEQVNHDPAPEDGSDVPFN